MHTNAAMHGFWGVSLTYYSLTWDHMGVKVSNDISSERTHQICSLKFMYTRRGVVKIEILIYWHFCCCLLVFCFFCLTWQSMGNYKMIDICETARRRAKQAKIWASCVSIFRVYIGYLWLLSVEIQFGVIRCISDFRRPCISETASRRAKRIKIWVSWVSI